MPVSYGQTGFLDKVKIMPLSKFSRYLKIFGVGGFLSGFAIPFLIVIKIIQASFFLIFFSHTISILGIFSAMLGLTGYADDFLRER